MGWELRHRGRYYLYRSRRVNGKPVKEYLAAADDRVGFGQLMAHTLDRLQRRAAKLRRLTRKARADYRGRIDELLATTETVNADLRTIADGLLCAIGYRKHHRGEWRMKRELMNLKTLIDQLKGGGAGSPKPVVRYDAPADDATAVELFGKARAGDVDALAHIRTLIRERKWENWLGDIGQEATGQLIRKAAGGDPVWAAGITQAANTLRNELLGVKPTVLEELLVRRAVNGWIATHALELELTVRPPIDPKSRDHLDRALTRAQKRLTEAIRELARVRQLQAPRLLAQLNVAVGGAVGVIAPALNAAGVECHREQAGMKGEGGSS